MSRIFCIPFGKNPCLSPVHENEEGLREKLRVLSCDREIISGVHILNIIYIP